MMRELIYAYEQLSYEDKLGMTGSLGLVNRGFSDVNLLFVDFDDWSDYMQHYLTLPTTSVFIRRMS